MDIKDIKDSLTALFTDDPVNWIKWGIVFAILIVGCRITIPLCSKILYRLSWERKRDIAKSRNHVIEAKLVREFPRGEVGRYNWHATYRYEFQGEERRYHAHSQCSPPRCLYLYYVDNLRRLFSSYEYHYENHMVIILLPIYSLPWILAAAAVHLLNIPLPPT